MARPFTQLTCPTWCYVSEDYCSGSSGGFHCWHTSQSYMQASEDGLPDIVCMYLSLVVFTLLKAFRYCV